MVALAVTPVCAFDGKRQGFVYGVRAGGGFTNYSTEVFGVFDGLDEGDRFDLTTSARFGRGFNEQFLLITELSRSWNSPAENSLVAFGTQIYFRPKSPSMYVLAAVGVASFDPEDLPTHYGLGLVGGLGWEFTKNWSVEATAGWGRAKRKEIKLGLFVDPGPRVESDVVMLHVTIGLLAY